MKKLFPLSILFLFCFLFTACDEEETASVVPETEATMERVFDFHNADANDEESYTLGAAEVQMALENDVLEIIFAPARPQGKEALVFIINKADLVNGYVGKYKVKSLPDADSGPAETTYYYYMGSGSGSALFSGGNTIDGELQIISFDPKNKLASGKFTVVMEDAFDPTKYNASLADVRTCDITVSGGFKNLKLVQP
ncbi:hypothetical protein ACFS7Z_01275 [Pontibacter toksunensis]|uniref:Lipoprotein n=1 Tax=Pontibacter toksunensis TaxID=1332631 RepID=A0ABW6BP37_9BACT